MSDDVEMEEVDGRDLGEHGVGIMEIDSDTSDISNMCKQYSEKVRYMDRLTD